MNITWVVVPTLGSHPRVLDLLDRIQGLKSDHLLHTCLIHNGRDSTFVSLLEARCDLYLRTSVELGYVRAVNVGLAAIGCAGDVVLMNDDVTHFESALMALRDSSFDITGPLTGASPHAPPGDERLAYGGGPLEPFAQRWQQVDYVYFHMVLIRAHVLRALGALDDRYHPGYYDDRAYCREALRRGFSIALDCHHVVEHQVSASFEGSQWDVSDLMERNRLLFDSQA